MPFFHLMARNKVYTQQVISGQKGVNLIEKVVLDMGFVWNPSTLDAGIDGIIEIRDTETGYATNLIIQVQSKATVNSYQADNVTSFEYICDERDLEYWMRGNAPVILICSQLVTGLSYWISIKDYFKDPNKLKTKKVVFNKKRDLFNTDAKDSLIHLAAPAESGIYLAPPPIKETLYSNLLPLKSYPDLIYSADIQYRETKELWKALSELEDRKGIHKAWMLHEGKIYSFTNLNYPPWTNVCEKVTAFKTSEWSQSHDINSKRNFIWLLKATFESFAYHKKLFHVRNDKVDLYYFQPIYDDQDLPKSMNKEYDRRGRKSSQSICERYYRKSDKTILSYFRHLAFEAVFHRFDRVWYLEITPTYFFTHDGKKIHRYYESKLKGKKGLDRAETVFSETLFWADVLTRKDGLFDKSILEFNTLKELTLDKGIKDLIWLEKEDEDRKNPNPYYKTLFET